MSTGKRQDAPDAGLKLVRAFVNTRDVEEETDAIAQPAALAAWLVDAGLAAPSTRATAADVRRAAAVREALRVELLHNGGHHDDLPCDDAVLDTAARRAKLRIAFSPQGRAGSSPTPAASTARSAACWPRSTAPRSMARGRG